MLRKVARLMIRALRKATVLVMGLYLLIAFIAAIMKASVDLLMIGLAALPITATVSALLKWSPEVLSAHIPVSESTVETYSRAVFAISTVLLLLFNVGAVAAFGTGTVTSYQFFLVLATQAVIYSTMFLAAFWTTINIKDTNEWPPEEDWKRYVLEQLNRFRENNE